MHYAPLYSYFASILLLKLCCGRHILFNTAYTLIKISNICLPTDTIITTYTAIWQARGCIHIYYILNCVLQGHDITIHTANPLKTPSHFMIITVHSYLAGSIHAK